MFGQVREDAAVDLFLLEQIKGVQRVFVVASGGCTALSILCAGDCRVDALDISQAQIALLALKSEIFKSSGFSAGRAACISDAVDAYDKARQNLTNEARSILDQHRHLMKGGLNNIGWIDRTMGVLTKLFYLFIHSRKTTMDFLSLAETSEQKAFYQRRWRTLRWKAAMAVAFNRRFLALRHGQAAMRLVGPEFSKVMEQRLERALTMFPNNQNPYLWQTFFGRYPGGENGFPPYLQQDKGERLVKHIPNLHLYCEDVLPWLEKQESNSIDYFGMSNILELLPLEYSKKLVAQLIRCGRKGSIICVRSIFPRHGQRTLADESGVICLDEELTSQADSLDRSLFCNGYEVYCHR